MHNFVPIHFGPLGFYGYTVGYSNRSANSAAAAMIEQFQPGDYFEEYSPITYQVIARGIVLKTATMSKYQILTVEYEDCPTWIGKSRRLDVALSFWCTKFTPERTEDSTF